MRANVKWTQTEFQKCLCPSETSATVSKPWLAQFPLKYMITWYVRNIIRYICLFPQTFCCSVFSPLYQFIIILIYVYWTWIRIRQLSLLRTSSKSIAEKITIFKPKSFWLRSVFYGRSLGTVPEELTLCIRFYSMSGTDIILENVLGEGLLVHLDLPEPK